MVPWAGGVARKSGWRSRSGGNQPSVSGSGAGAVSLRAKSKAEVRSPQTARRQGEMLGSWTPKRCSMKRMTEVWSKVSEQA